MSAQAPAPIRVDVSLVNVGFSVRDEKGNLVTDLTQDDFEITEDGVPQKISFFARSTDVPLTLGLDHGRERQPAELHQTSPQRSAGVSQNRAAPARSAFLVCFGNNLRLMSDYTNSAKDLVMPSRAFEKGEDHGELSR